jgi:TonB-dependent SusC/RagA subfamily outer membrane receptor
VIDGVPMNERNMRDITPAIVESIDVFKFATSAAAFGARGGDGVISITTRNGRGESSEIEKFNQKVYTPLGYQKPVEFYAPKYETLESKHPNIPDYRTTIFWKPDIVISEYEEKATFEFYTSDFPTTYSVVIEGLTSDGKIVRQVENIRVK